MKNRTASQWTTAIEPFRRALDGGKRILTLDPSSSCTGLAVYDCDQPTGLYPKLIHAARLKGKNSSQKAYDRVDHMNDLIQGVVKSYGVDFAAVEITSGKTSTRHGGAGAGLAIYGVAVGAIRTTLHHLLGRCHVLDVYENEWTQRTTKRERWTWCAANFPSHAALWKEDEGNDNRGYDASDAAYLFDWCRTMANYTRTTERAQRTS